MKIFNYTPHAVCIIAEDDTRFEPSIRKFVAPSGATAQMSIPSKGMLSARIETVPGTDIAGIPTFVKKVTGCDPIPEDVTADDIIIVSALYVSAYRATYGDDHRLYTVADPVYDESDPRRILGSRGICPAF